MKIFWLCFVPLFVAVDALGLLPLFINLTQGLERQYIRRIIFESVITAMVVALVFLFVGKGVLTLLGITVADFMIAGGVLLFVISLSDLLTAEKRRLQLDQEGVGAVPLGVPLMVGPGVLTTTILLTNQYGMIPTVSATIVNIAIAGIVFSMSESINRILGKAGTRTISKLSSLILAAIGVMMARKGIMLLISAGATSSP
jgi:multiple antibiotic resistance protein